MKWILLLMILLLIPTATAFTSLLGGTGTGLSDGNISIDQWFNLFDIFQYANDSRPEYYNLPRQSFPKAYHPNGYIDIIKRSIFHKPIIC